MWILSVVETDDGHPDNVDDLHPLVDQDLIAFLNNKDHSVEIEHFENNNSDIEVGRY